MFGITARYVFPGGAVSDPESMDVLYCRVNCHADLSDKARMKSLSEGCRRLTTSVKVQDQAKNVFAVFPSPVRMIGEMPDKMNAQSTDDPFFDAQ